MSVIEEATITAISGLHVHLEVSRSKGLDAQSISNLEDEACYTMVREQLAEFKKTIIGAGLVPDSLFDAVVDLIGKTSKHSLTEMVAKIDELLIIIETNMFSCVDKVKIDAEFAKEYLNYRKESLPTLMKFVDDAVLEAISELKPEKQQLLS